MFVHVYTKRNSFIFLQIVMNQLVQLGVRQLCSTPGTSPLLVRAGTLLGKLATQSRDCLHRQFPLHSSPTVLPSRGVATAGVLRAAVREQSGPGADGPADREPSPEAKYRARMFTVATGAACAFFGASYLLYRQLTVRAEEATIEVSICVYRPCSHLSVLYLENWLSEPVVVYSGTSLKGRP